MDRFTQAYIEAALWSSTDNSRDDGGDPLDANYSIEEISSEAMAQIEADCAKFQHDNAATLDGLLIEQCGHDFWLTRNGHGAGFWDRGLGAVGEELTKASKVFGECDLYVGDDGLVYCS